MKSVSFDQSKLDRLEQKSKRRIIFHPTFMASELCFKCDLSSTYTRSKLLPTHTAMALFKKMFDSLGRHLDKGNFRDLLRGLRALDSEETMSKLKDES